jgi:hypothetical protein
MTTIPERLAVDLNAATHLLLHLQVLEYCEHHCLDNLPSNDSEPTEHQSTISEWDREFIAVDQKMLFEIVLAANYLCIDSLL